MLTILNDPTGVTGRRRIAWDCTATMQENIARHIAGGADCELLIDGVKVDPLTDVRLDRRPQPHDEATVVRRPGADPVTWLYVISAALAIYSYSLIPKNRAQPTPADSPNNSLTGQSNIARAYQAIPDVYGLRRVWPDLIQPSIIEYIDNEKFVTEWLCVSRGKGTATAVQFAETPIDDIDGASYELFEPSASPNALPELNTTTITDVVEPFASPEVNGQTLAFGAIGIERPAANGTDQGVDGGGYFFELDLFDDASLADLKAAPIGTAVFVQLGIGGTILWQRDCTLRSYTAGGLGCLFTFYIVGGTAGDLPGLFAFNPVRFILATGGGAATLGPFTLPIANATKIRWNTVFQRGLKGSVKVRATWWQIDGAGAEISGTRETLDVTRTADTYDPRYYTNTVTPAAGAGRYRIQFTRISADLGNGADVAQLEAVYALREFASKSLPGVTVLRATTKATTQATGFRDRKFNLRWARYVRQLTSTTLGASRNFGRIMAHIWVLAGQSISELDTTKLAAINAALGEDSPLLRFDGSLDDADMSLGERLQRIAFHARCVIWRDGLVWTVTREQQRATPELQLDYRNLAAGGESAISYASHLPASNDGVEVEYTDETTQATKAFARFSVASGAVVAGSSVNPVKIKMPGCATLSQAVDRGILEARRLLFQRTSVRDTALADGGQLGIGSLVRWVDPNDFAGDDGLQAGEVLAFDGTTVKTSEPIDFKGLPNGRIVFTKVDGSYCGAPVQCTPGASTSQIVLSTVPSYITDGVFVRDGVTRQLGSRYAFGVGLTSAELESAGLYTVTEIEPGDDGTVALSLVNYDARLYPEVSVMTAANETDVAQPMTRALRFALAQASETDTAQAMTVV